MKFKEKAIRALINTELKLYDKTAAVNTTEMIILLLAAVTIATCVVIAIKKMLGDGETEENGGALKKFKDGFEARQS